MHRLGILATLRRSAEPIELTTAWSLSPIRLTSHTPSPTRPAGADNPTWLKGKGDSMTAWGMFGFSACECLLACCSCSRFCVTSQRVLVLGPAGPSTSNVACSNVALQPLSTWAGPPRCFVRAVANIVSSLRCSRPRPDGSRPLQDVLRRGKGPGVNRH
jgi:hypothetical protein